MPRRRRKRRKRRSNRPNHPRSIIRFLYLNPHLKLVRTPSGCRISGLHPSDASSRISGQTVKKWLALGYLVETRRTPEGFVHYHLTAKARREARR